MSNNTTELSFENNPELHMADAFVRNTGANVFLTGKAGTGKTTFLQGLKSDCHKQMVVAAPTGVAAVNAGGVTLHSFFQLSFGPNIPGQTGNSRDGRFFRFSKEKKRIIKGLDLLIIDEISMVRADLLDAVDGVLRRLRRNDRPFGGVQLLLIGDLFQLPPVVRPDELELLSPYYPSLYFFDSQALKRAGFVTVELQKIYRQSDPGFINLLNKVRENRLDPPAMALLDECANRSLPESGTITLTTHNRKADDINRDRLARLAGDARVMKAEVEGDFPATSFPTPDRLTLKKGAQVMFLRNDNSPDKRWFNGKIGRVSAILGEKVLVTDPGGTESPVEVAPVAWENVSYRVNDADQTVTQEVVGTFSQVPLKLAWAVTIHKSQGLTFDRAVVDAGDAFAHGQTYVALSRCRTIEGLSLSTPVPRNGVAVDPCVAQFMTTAVSETAALSREYEAARRAYQQDLLLQCFDFSAMRGMFYYFMRLADTSGQSVRVAGLGDVSVLKDDARKLIFEVGGKFQNQLRGMLLPDMLPDDDPGIADRTKKAFGWFGEKFDLLFSDLLEKGQVTTDNQSLKKQMTNGLANLVHEIRVRRAGIRSCANGFSSKIYLRAVSSAGMIAQPKISSASAPDYTEFDIEHPQLFKTLREWRNAKAKALGVPAFQVLHQKVLVQLAVGLPGDITAMGKLKGVGPKTLELYGDDLLGMIREYREEKGIKTVILPEPKTAPTGTQDKKKERADTKQVSLALFEGGMDVQAVADERGLAPSTIYTHLVHFIEAGTLALDRLVPEARRRQIEKALVPERPLGQVKADLGEGFSYGEIRAVAVHLKRTFNRSGG